MRTPRKKRLRRPSPAILAARLNSRVTIERRPGGDVVASFNGMSLPLGQFGAAAGERARELKAGLPLATLAASRKTIDKVVNGLKFLS